MSLPQSHGIDLRDDDLPWETTDPRFHNRRGKAEDYVRLSSIVLAAHVRARSMPGLASFGLREAAARLLRAHYGDVAGPAGQGLASVEMNIMALALAMPRLTVYRLKPEAVEVVMETDLKSMPDEPPRLLRSGFLVEVDNPVRETLFPRTTALGGYRIGDTWWLITQHYPDGVSVYPWKPLWERGIKPAVGIQKESPLIPGDRKRIDEWLQSGGGAASFGVILGILLDAAGTPIEQTVDVQRTNRLSREPHTHDAAEELKKLSGRHAVGWAIHTLSIPAGYRQSPAREEHDGPETDFDPEGRGLTPVMTQVRGYLKRQPTSDGQKWIYVAPYEGIRYRSDKPVRVVVNRRLA